MQGVPKNAGLTPADVTNFPIQILHVLEAGSSAVSVHVLVVCVTALLPVSG